MNDDMATLPGLFQRNGVWSIRVVIPLDLRSAYGGSSKVVESLGTTSNSTARLKGTKRRSELLEQFHLKRRELNPQRVEHVSAELGALLAQRVAARVLTTDDTLRAKPEAAALLLDSVRPSSFPIALLIPGVPARVKATSTGQSFDPLDGLTSELLAELREANAAVEANSALDMAMQRVRAVLPMVKAEALAIGLEFDEKAPGALDALRECLKAYRQAWQTLTRRDEGEVLETPAAPARVDAVKVLPKTLRHVVPQWKASKTRKPQTVQAAMLALADYEKATGNPPIATLTRSMGVDFRAVLLASGVSPKTANDKLNYVKGFLNFATTELELMSKNPWYGLAIETSGGRKRSPWSSEQLGALFGRPLFTAYDIPPGWDAGADAAYWVPLLGLFTGARIGELCQLRVSDVIRTDGVDMLRITNQGEGQTVKTDAGLREVPIHPELVRLGFLDYAKAIKDAGAVQLFPAMRLAPTKPGNYFSSWFATQRPQADGPALPDFHSFRHTVRSKLASAGVSEPLIDTLIGHEVQGSTGARTYTRRTPEDLQVAMQALGYRGLKLPRVFTKPAKLKGGDGKRGRKSKITRAD